MTDKTSNSEYFNSVLEYVVKLKPDSRILIKSISNNPEQFTKTVMQIIDLRLVEVEFSNDYDYIIRRENVNYEKYKKG